MIRWKLVVPYTIIQTLLSYFLLGLLSFIVTSCGPTDVSTVLAVLFPVLLVAAAVSTFPLGWLGTWLVGPLFPSWLLLISMAALSLANSLLWDQFLQAWRRFWNRFEEKQKQCRVLEGDQS